MEREFTFCSECADYRVQYVCEQCAKMDRLFAEMLAQQEKVQSEDKNVYCEEKKICA
jgi:hypothetical protein